MNTPKHLFSCLLLLFCAVTLSAQHIKPDIGIGDVIPELVWKDRTIKKNVKIINSVAGRVILGIDGETEAIRIEDFQKIVQLTNSSLDAVRQEVAAKEKLQEEEARKRSEALVASQNGTSPAPPPAPTAPSLPTPTPPAPLAVPTTPTTPPASPFGTPATPPAPTPDPAPSIPPTPMPVPENPFNNTVTPPTSPTPVPTPPVSTVIPEPVPPAPTPTPLPTPVPEPVTPPIPTPEPPSPRPGPAAEEPYEVKLLRKSIHSRMIRLQEDYLASLEELRTDYQNKGEASTAQQIDQAIYRAKQQQLKLESIVAQKGKKGPKKQRGLRSQEAPIPTITQNIPSEEIAPTITVAPTIPSGSIPSPLDLTPEPEPTPEPVPAPTIATPPSTPVPPADSTGKPQQSANGQIPIVMASIEAGDQPGMLPKYIQKWGPLKQEMVEGSPYWTVEIDYMADSIFGVFPSRAKALIQQNRVVRWITLPR